MRHSAIYTLFFALSVTGPSLADAEKPSPAAEAPPSTSHRAAPKANAQAPQVSTAFDVDKLSEQFLTHSTLGLALGEASGVSLSTQLDARQRVNALLGFSLQYPSLISQLDYNFHFFKWVPARDYGVELSFFAGAGLRLGLFETRPAYLRELPFALGARIPFGVIATLPPLPMELELNAAPGLDLSPNVRFHGEAALALRFQLQGFR